MDEKERRQIRMFALTEARAMFVHGGATPDEIEHYVERLEHYVIYGTFPGTAE